MNQKLILIKEYLKYLFKFNKVSFIYSYKNINSTIESSFKKLFYE